MSALLLAIGTVEIVSLSAVGLGTVSLGFMYWRRQQRRQQAEALLQGFKEQVVAYSDAMDSIKERHKMLPFTDPDFTAPMVGETLAAYEGVETALKQHGDRWLQLMDVWDQAQKLLEEKGTADRLQTLLEDTNVSDHIVELKQDCEIELHRLEQSHQRVDSRLDTNTADLQEIESDLTQAREAGLSTEPYDLALAEIASRTEEGVRLRAADPLNAELELEQAKLALAQLGEQVDGVLAQFRRAQEVFSKHQQAVQLVDQSRAEGLLLAEGRGNPTPMLCEAEEAHGATLAALQGGDEETAVRRLDTAENLIDQAVESVEFQAMFRKEGAERIRQLQSEVRALSADIAGAQKSEEDLQKRHAPAAWRMVDDNVQQAAELADAVQQLLEEAATAATDERQHYHQAQQLIDEAIAELPEAKQLVSSVQKRLNELDELAERSARLAADLDAESRRLEKVLRSSTSDRPRSNHRFELATETLNQILQDTQQGRPDWMAVERGLQHVAKDLHAVDEMVREDLRLAEQAHAEVREAAHELRRCQGFYQMGISPNIGQAEGELRSAERAVQRQNYEEAIQLANAAEQAARDALQRAQQEAEEREREAQRRRNRETAMQMASVIASVAAQAAATMASRRYRRRF